MTDVTILAVLVRTTLLEVAKQASALGTGLQNAAPGDKAASPNFSIQYLLKVADDLGLLAEEVDQHKTQLAKLLELGHSVVQLDDKLREQFQVGVKFKFIHDRLAALSQQMSEHAAQLQEKTVERTAKDEVQDDEMVVWVYLFNLQGLTLQTWQKMLLPSVFYEYSVNRPIYTDQAHVETLIRQKANRVQHGYLKVVIKKAGDVSETTNDVCGNPIIKVKEGSLKFERLVAFYHNKNEYHVGESGQLERVAF